MTHIFMSNIPHFHKKFLSFLEIEIQCLNDDVHHSQLSLMFFSIRDLEYTSKPWDSLPEHIVNNDSLIESKSHLVTLYPLLEDQGYVLKCSESITKIYISNNLHKLGDFQSKSGDREICLNVLKIREISRDVGRLGTSASGTIRSHTVLTIRLVPKGGTYVLYQ